MDEIRRYEVRGTAAMACRTEQPDRGAIIDYDIARRSYETRQRLARRQAAAGRPMPRATESSRITSAERIGFLDAARATYDPDASMSRTLGNIVSSIARAIARNPFIEQLRNGSSEGFETGKATHRQVLASATAGMVLSCAIMFVGI